jgi:hypothetical protein
MCIIIGVCVQNEVDYKIMSWNMLMEFFCPKQMVRHYCSNIIFCDL